MTKNSCPVCVETARYSCFEKKHVTACQTCSTCYSPEKHRRCLWCYDTMDPDWDHDSWMQWFQEQAKDSQDPEVARMLEKMGGMDLENAVKDKELEELVGGMEKTTIEEKVNEKKK
ncbi:hypothetical protein BJX64DRAFT_288828 [Aspergillus heterothallicus]